MANAGYSADNEFITEAIRNGKLIIITRLEHPIIQDFKERINFLIKNDKISYYTYNGKKYPTHSAWSKKYKLLIKINQIRMKNWFWDKIV